MASSQPGRKGVRVCAGYNRKTVLLNRTKADVRKRTPGFRNHLITHHKELYAESPELVALGLHQITGSEPSQTHSHSYLSLRFTTSEVCLIPQPVGSFSWIDQDHYLPYSVSLSRGSRRSLVAMTTDIHARLLAMSALGRTGHVENEDSHI
ncbi:uncharacterized protein BCR38DRAFT_442587 [Pseudomassariella vexata]|uniref:Uncharacterized protein n=1 Tax=Pseudomassariella vexata TaxID=1141098 RepID=A0A1Y2DNG2_9PEZI|nr:uncharacterized protein BCR38DRAFT_442587 [Pseudomassariella vexata]ORY60812.1 hypothetical protein BCR38DRAFT_442587 [Pseudomassariella vexata]